MEIKLIKGNKTEGDKIIIINSENEAINIFDIALIINQFGINELKIIDSQGFSREQHFWFNVLINKAIADSKENIDWFNCDKEELIKLSSYPYFVKRKSIDKFLDKRENDKN